MLAVKENRVYTITEQQRREHAAQGFDITDESGRIIEYAAGKTVPYSRYAALLDENRQLRAELKALSDVRKPPVSPGSPHPKRKK